MNIYIIQPEDIGKPAYHAISSKCECCGTIIKEYPFGPLGPKVLKNDVGKKCQKIKGRWYVENQEQFEKRTGKK